MELKSYGQILRNKVLFRWVPALRPAVYRLYAPNPAPVFVFGNQKSGTSAIAALLAKACGLSYDIDLGGLRVAEYERIHANPEVLDDVLRECAAIEFSKALVKEPNLTFLSKELRALYPRSERIFIVRDPRDNLRSICNRLKIPGDLPRIATTDYPEISPMWEAILLNRWVKDDRTDLNYIGRSAERWRTAARYALEARAVIRYEDFRKDKRASIERLADTVGLPVRADITPYVDVNYQPKGQRVDDYRTFFGKENLRLINEICGEEMEAFGYKTDIV